VKVAIESSHGEERIISLLGPDAIVGELAMIDGLPRSASVIAITDCSLFFVSRKRFQAHTEKHPEITDYLMRTLARRLREADDALAAATFLTVKGRVARALLNLAEYVGHDDGKGHIQLRHRLNQTDIAAMAGVARENVSRTLSDWRRRHLVGRSENYYCINDARALAREMEFES
jgi:CRP-like cAMP-binding protein